jgi:mono/diheme cytochrome c family protein
MNKKVIPLAVVAVIVLGLLYWAFGVPSVGDPAISTDPAAIARGAYIYNAGGCGSCHQLDDAEGPSGGFEIESPFGGTFVAPNITPDEDTGIGGWTGRDFLRALKHGRSPGGGFYWPAFPYRSYSGMTDEDVLDLAAYLVSIPAIRNEVPEHDLPGWQFSWMMAGWNIMADVMEGAPPAVADDPQIQRGAYLARALGHCGECHTPRNSLGMMQLSQELGGAEGIAPAIDADGIAAYGFDDLVYFLQEGATLDFEIVAGEMGDVIEHTRQLTLEDQQAYAAFLLRDVE